ncbi:MAG: hypothetical protein RR818_02405 [Citrobacter sp.]
MTAQQPEALRLADALTIPECTLEHGDCMKAGELLRTLHARVQDLEAQQERKPLTPDSSKVVSDEDLLRAFAGTNFGTTDYRPLLHQAVLKKACDYHCGHTITQIMKELGLIGTNGRPLKKGVNMLRIAYHEQMVKGP